MVNDTQSIQRRAHLFLGTELTRQLDSAKADFGEATRTGTVRRLVEFHREYRVAKDGILPVTAKMMVDDRPALITGSSGAGKSRTIRELIKDWPGPVFALDVKGVDYDFERLDLGRISSYDWASAADARRLRFAPSAEISAQAESEAVLQLLSLVMLQSGKPLRNWTVILEEGQRFAKNSSFKVILSEGRVFCRKILIASQASRPFKETVPVYLPMVLSH